MNVDEMLSQGMLTVNELRLKLGISRSYAYKLVNMKLFPVIKLADDTIRIPIKPFNEWLCTQICA
jgi:predicted DNA-binding transcriptional regulator AlpA